LVCIVRRPNMASLLMQTPNWASNSARGVCAGPPENLYRPARPPSHAKRQTSNRRRQGWGGRGFQIEAWATGWPLSPFANLPPARITDRPALSSSKPRAAASLDSWGRRPSFPLSLVAAHSLRSSAPSSPPFAVVAMTLAVCFRQPNLGDAGPADADLADALAVLPRHRFLLQQAPTTPTADQATGCARYPLRKKRCTGRSSPTTLEISTISTRPLS
jgi:hypothetical protein